MNRGILPRQLAWPWLSLARDLWNQERRTAQRPGYPRHTKRALKPSIST
jgi:hypothetical protein